MATSLHRSVLRLVLVVGAAVLFTPIHPSALDLEAIVITDATTALQHSLEGRNAIPISIMRRAEAIAVFPATPTEAIFHEGSGVIGGRGQKSGRWLPAVVSFKAKLRILPGRRVGNIIIIALTRKGFDHLAQRTFSVAPASEIPAGPVGQNTAENMKTDFVAYGQYRRTFAGVAVEQIAIEEDSTALNMLYGPGVGLYEVLNGRVRNGPAAALVWQKRIEAFLRELN